MYANETKGCFPYPTTTKGQANHWFTALDKYMVENTVASRSGVAQLRTFHEGKQCVVWADFEGPVNGTVAQDNLKEFAKTYKMNSHLRRNSPASHAKTSMVKKSSEFVLLADATSLDHTGDIPSQYESGQLSMEVNDSKWAGPALRHRKGANVLFVDGHVELIKLPTYQKSLQPPNANIKVLTWESEYLDASGNPTDSYPFRTTGPSAFGATRNPDMPLIWSDPPTLHR